MAPMLLAFPFLETVHMHQAVAWDVIAQNGNWRLGASEFIIRAGGGGCDLAECRGAMGTRSAAWQASNGTTLENVGPPPLGLAMLATRQSRKPSNGHPKQLRISSRGRPLEPPRCGGHFALIFSQNGPLSQKL